MRTLGNILWFIFAGLWLGLSWWIAGILWCITIIGIPIGLQCFKLSTLAFFPFKKEIEYTGAKVASTLANVFWILFSGWILALESVLVGILLCITIVGIPFGMQCFKLAKLALIPFGAVVVKRTTPPQY